MTVKYVRYSELKDGDRIYLQGHLFKVMNVRLVDTFSKENPKVVRFKGVCTEDKFNDDIRHTAYDGGTYGAYPWVYATIEKEADEFDDEPFHESKESKDKHREQDREAARALRQGLVVNPGEVGGLPPTYHRPASKRLD